MTSIALKQNNHFATLDAEELSSVVGGCNNGSWTESYVDPETGEEIYFETCKPTGVKPFSGVKKGGNPIGSLGETVQTGTTNGGSDLP